MLSRRKIVIITAPSGAGKTTITHYLLQAIPELSFSVSAATRNARGNEVNGLDYYFISAAQFQQKIQRNEFVEWEMVYEGKYYGTLRSELERIWKQDKVPLLDIDVKGAIHVQRQYPDSSLTIFIEAPSVDELKKRLEARGTESAASINARVNKAAYELSFKDEFDHIIINKDLQQACREAEQLAKSFLEH